MKLQPGTDKKTQGHAYTPGKLPRGAPGPSAVIPVMKQPSSFQDRQNVSPITAPPRAGGVTGGLMAAAAKKAQAMSAPQAQPAYPNPDHAGSQQPQQPQAQAPRPGATGPGGGPPVAQLPQQPQVDPMKQAAAQQYGATPRPTFAPQLGAGLDQMLGPQQYDPKAAGGGAGLPPLEQIGGTQPGQGSSVPAGQAQPGYGTGANPNPLPGQPANKPGGGLPGQPADPNALPADNQNYGGQGETEEMGVPHFTTPEYTKDPYPGPNDPGGLVQIDPNAAKTDANGNVLSTGQDGMWVNGKWVPNDKDAAPPNIVQDYETSPTDPDAWKGGDDKDWWEQWLKGSIQGEKWGPGDEWVKQQGDSIALDAEKQAAADKMKSQSMYGAAGLGGSGMAVGGMGQIDSAKNAAVTSARADLAGQQAKLGIQDKIAQLGTQMQLAKQAGDVALQEKLATDLLKFQQQESLLNMIENAPEKAMEYIDAKSFADSTQHQKMMEDLKAAYDSNDPSAVLAVLMKMGKNGDGKATYETGLSNKSTEEQAKLNQEFEAWWADYSKKMQDLGYDPGPKDFDKWYAEKHPGE